MTDTSAYIYELPAPAILENPAGVSLFLDLDGTLAPIADFPSDVGPDQERNSMLACLEHRLAGRLAVVSGRSIADIDHILGHSVQAVAGVHGLERRNASGDCFITREDPKLGDIRTAFQALADTQAGLVMEDKGSSIALHYRGLPAAETALQELSKHLAQATGLILQQGNMLVELRTPGPDKGDAIRAFLSEAPFIGSTPIFVGDDLTDEDGFAAVEKAGGTGILVGPSRETKASHGLADVKAVFNWLNALLQRGPAWDV